MKCIIVTYSATKFWILKQSIVQNKYNVQNWKFVDSNQKNLVKK